ncbi:potassium channel-like protein [Phyllosticta citribraziliensis]|uniref:Potassium channel-like protein n=1 Tax=Phyllosticta citribraziliensis TaxID=989973 RepID=A0ABR1LPL4_9PEZI
MNDPGVDDPINNAAEDLENNAYESIRQQVAEEEHDFLDPSRWWFASTACPLIAGTFGPLANAFSICALAVKWRLYIPPGHDETTGEFLSDPAWLLAINVVSLVCALVANFSLLLNMARRLSFNVAQPITIGGFSVASVLLIALVCVASSSHFRLQPAASHALSQAYYYAIIAASIYAIVALLMVLTVYGASKNHYAKEFRLTISQRTLMLQTISFTAYLLLGGLVFSRIEGWDFLDGIYWADYTLLTVGLGSDFPPKTHLGRSLLFPFAFGGILMVGLVIGSIRSLVLERGKAKIDARMTEIRREKVLEKISAQKRIVTIGYFQKVKFVHSGLSELERREQEFDVMRKIQSIAQKRRQYTALLLSILAACILWFIGAVVFKATEGKNQAWSYFDALYFSYTSLLTIGYGDLYPHSNSGKPFFVIWSLLAVPTLTILISNMGDTVVKSFADFTIWLGSLTVLPHESGIRATVESNLAKLRQSSLLKRDASLSENQKPSGRRSGANGEHSEDSFEDKKSHLDSVALNHLSKHIEDEELLEAEEAGEKGDTLERDIHFYHFVLAKEIRKLMRDAAASPPCQYTYAEWAYYLKLIGQDEADPERHRKPPIKPRRRHLHQHDGGPDLGVAGGDPGEEGSGYSWSWLGTRSPLMGSKSEAQWILERMSATLEAELKKMRAKNYKENRGKPPISMEDLRRKKS